MLTAHTKSADDTRALAAELAAVARPGDLFLLAGDLGAGKTTWTQGLARGLGVTDRVTSPTFTLVQTYPGRLQLLHADVYRLDHLQEVVDLGLPELVEEDAVAVVEWGDLAAPAMPRDFLAVRIGFDDASDPNASDDARTFVLEPIGASWIERLPAVADALSAWVERGPS